MKKNRKNKWIDILIFVILFACVVLTIFYFYDRRKKECTSNPLVFGAKLYEQNYDVKAIGSLNLYPIGEGKLPTTIIFNSKNFTVQDNFI